MTFFVTLTRKAPGGIARSARALARFPGNRRGTVSVEFAILAVVLFAILFGIMVYGFQFTTRIALSYAVAEGGRAAIAGLNPEERQARGVATVEDVLDTLFPLVDRSLANITVLPAGSSDYGDQIEVSVVYTDTRFSTLPFVPERPESVTISTIFVVSDPSN